MFKPSKLPTKMYSLSCVHISFKIIKYVPHLNNSRPPVGERPTFWEPLT
jgi:hypothetical protein